MFGSWRARAIWVCLLGFLPATGLMANDETPAPSSLIRDAAWGRALGQILFWDTVQAIAPSGSDRATDSTDRTQVVQILLARHPLDRYRWLIERAFDDSLWQGADDSTLRKNFALIWRLSTRLYEAMPSTRPMNLRVCRPGDSPDEFHCEEEAEPVEMIPIPSREAPLIPLHDQTIG